MSWMPVLPEYGVEAYAPFDLPAPALRPVEAADALREDHEVRRAGGVRGFGDPRFWVAAVAYCAAMPLFFASGVTWDSFQTVMPFLISFIVVATLAWDFRLVGDPNRPACLTLHALFTVSSVFLLNRLMTAGAFAADAAAEAAGSGFLSGLWDAGVEMASAIPGIGWLSAGASFLLDWVGYAVILFFVAGAVIFPRRVAASLLFVFGLIFLAVSVGQNLNPTLWSLGLGLLLMTVAFAVQLADEKGARFWSRVASALRYAPPAPTVDMDIKLALLRLLREKKSLGEKQIRSLIASRLGVRPDDPRVPPVCIRIAEQLSARDGLAESRDGGEGWRFVLSVPEDPADFFALTARVIRIALTLAFSVIYILSPIDIIPDPTPVLGVADDMLLGTVAILSTVRTIYAGSHAQ